MSGKGDKQRPMKITGDLYDLKYKLAFVRNLSDKDKKELKEQIEALENGVNTSGEARQKNIHRR